MTKTPANALQDLLIAVKFNAPPVDFGEGNMCYEARVPVAFVEKAEAALLGEDRAIRPPYSAKEVEDTLKSLLAQDDEFRKDLTIVRKIAEETVLKIRGSYDAPAFEACVREEMASLLRAAANTF